MQPYKVTTVQDFAKEITAEMDRPRYKYIPGQYADDMLSKGTIKVGSFSDYRNCEHAEIGDPNELKGISINVIDELSFANGSSFKNLTLVDDGEINDQLAYCVTRSPSKQCMREFNADVCIEISNIVEFAFHVSIALFMQNKNDSNHFQVQNCIYMEERKFLNCGLPFDCFTAVKEMRYSHQHETRAIFKNRSVSPIQLSPEILDVPGIIPLLKVINL